MPRTFLDIPVTRAELDHSDYNPIVAQGLERAYLNLDRRLYADAQAAVEHVRHQPMSDRQRLRVFYVLAQAAHADGRYDDAADTLEIAIDLAERMDELDAFAQLAHFLAAQYDHLDQWATGAQASAAALAAWRSGPAASGPPDPLDASFLVDIRDRLAIELFYVARLDEAAEQLHAASTLSPFATRSAMRGAGIQWTLALIERWRARPEHAREHVRAAFDVYAASGDPFELPRLQILIADIGLDLAAGISRAGIFESRDTALAFVERHLLQSVAQTSANGDVRSHCRALLTYTRYQRLAGHNTNRLAVIESVGRTATRLSDTQLIGMYCTEFGDELAFLGDREAAKNAYRQALDTFALTQAPGLSVWAYRALYDTMGH
jgi:tetratricopeptide (TPR) repeat protein